MKKLFTLFVGAVVGLGAYAQDFDSGGLMYSVLSPDDKTCAVTGKGDYYESILQIPETVEFEEVTYTVTEVAADAFRWENWAAVNFPSTLLKIGESAFWNCNGIRDLYIPESVKEIGYSAFGACFGMNRVTLEGSLDYIAYGAFSEAPIIFLISNSETPVVFDGGFESVFTSNPIVAVPAASVEAYREAWSGANIIANDTDNEVRSMSFSQSVYEVQPGESIKLDLIVDPTDAVIGYNINHTDLFSIDDNGVVTTKLMSAGWRADVMAMSANNMQATCYVQVADFERFNVDYFQYGIIPNADHEVIVMALYNGYCPEVINIPETVEYNGSIYNVTTLNNNIFTSACEGLKEVTIPAMVKEIGYNNFFWCPSLVKVTIEDSSEPLRLDGYVIASNQSLSDLYVGRDVVLSEGAFSDNRTLKKIVIGSQVTDIPDYAFSGNNNLNLIESLNPVPPVLGEWALGYNNPTILVPAESVEAYKEAWEQYASCITLPVDAESISFETEEITIYNGQGLQLPIVIEPADAVVTFSSSVSYLVSVNREGYVYYYTWDDSVGEAIITASTLNGLTAECKVIAKHWLTFSEDNITLVPGSTYQVEVSRPDVIADAAITWWSANEEIATVDENGMITAVAGGDAEIYASVNVPELDQTFTYYIQVKVRNYPTEVIAEEPTMTVWQGWEQAIHLNYEPQDDEYLSRELTWTVADPEIAEIHDLGSNNYGVYGLTAGTTTITGEAPNGVKVEIEVVVKAQIDRLIFPTDKAYVAPGETYQLTFTTVPEVTNQTFRYVIGNEEIATISEDGVITGVSLGETYIDIWYDTPWGSSNWTHRVEVCYLPENVTLENHEIEMYVKQTKQLDLVFTPEGEDLNKDMTWTVENPEIVRIDGNNTWDPELGIERKSYEIVGLAEGTTRFVGTTVNGITVEGDVTVKPLMGPESVTLVNNEITVNVDTYEKLDLQFTPSENVNTEITWEIDKSVAEIYLDEFWNYETGNYEPGYAIRGVNFGETNFEGIAANGDLINGHVTVAGIKIINTPNEVTIGEEFKLNFIASEDVNLEGVTYYSSNPDILSVSEDGMVSADNCGSTWLYIQYNEDDKNYNNSIYVTVRPASGTIALSQSQVIMLPNYSVGVDVLFPLDEYYDITWETSDPNVATIYGGWSWATIYYAGLGTATITATASNGATATCEVSCIALNKTDLIMGLDQTRQLEIVGIPEDMSVNVEWYAYNAYNVDEGDNPDDPENVDVVRINEEGVVTSENIGRARVGVYIYNAANGAWIGELYTYVDVIENFQYVTAIILNETSIAAEEGESVQLIATIDPADATDQQLAWSSSDESVATVDQNGLVTIVAEGSAVITATATDGSGIMANCYISGLSGINGIFGDGEPADVYNMNGILVKKDATAADFNKLAPGIYVVRRGNVSTKLIRR